MFAITPRGIGKRVGARRIQPGWPLGDVETFTVEDWQEDLVLADDGLSLREGAPAELDPPTTAQVNTERDRRLMAMTDTASLTDAFYAVIRANSEASRLMNKELRRKVPLTAAETARATELENRDAAVLALDDAAQAIRADIEAGTYSGNIATDPRWPAPSL